MQNARGFEYGVRHILSPLAGNLSKAVCTELGITIQDFQFLLNFGAIYYKGQRILNDAVVSQQDYIRVHTKPRRFPIENLEIRDSIIFNNDNFVVLNKPAGIPVHPTVDNIKENILFLLEQHFQHPLYITHRLDVPTQGLIVYAKNKEFQSAFNRLLINQAITKKYKALCEGTQSSIGIIQHFMKPSPRGPKVVSTQAQEGWQECLLEIESSLPKDLNRSEVSIRLITGRTHQIRAQMSALGHPIVGDHTYGAVKVYDFDKIDLKAYSLEFEDPFNQEKYSFQL